MKKNALSKLVLSTLLVGVLLVSGAVAGCSATPKTDSTQDTTTQKANSIDVKVLIDTSSVSDEATQTYSVTVDEGATIYDALKATDAVVASSSSAAGMYVSSINSLAEKDHGDMSGWGYSVNDEMPTESCDKVTLSNGDTVTWTYYK